MTHKNRKKSRIFMFLSTGCSLLRAEGFSCSLGILYGGLEISKLHFLIKKIEIKFPARNFIPSLIPFAPFLSSAPHTHIGFLPLPLPSPERVTAKPWILGFLLPRTASFYVLSWVSFLNTFFSDKKPP
jgi:hypothetical protein